MQTAPLYQRGDTLRIARTVSLFLLFIAATHSLRAQFNQYRNYDVKDGLPSSEVYDVLQDSRGFIWFATDMGVSRYDGYEFRTFTTDDGLADNTNFNVYEDHAGRIWFTSFSGKVSYFLNEKMYRLSCNDHLADLMNGYLICSIYVDAHDTIWAGTTKNMSIRIAPGWTSASVDTTMYSRYEGYLLLIGEEGMIYGSTNIAKTGVTVYDGASRKLFAVPFFEPDQTQLGIRFSFTRLHNGNILATANNRVAIFNASGVMLANNDLGVIGICTLEEPDGSMVVGTYDGLLTLNASLTSYTVTSRFDQKIVTAVMRDTEGGTWYCTEGNGVYYFSNSAFLYYTPDDGLPESKITSIALEGDALYTGHIDGVVCRLEGQLVHAIVPEPAGTFPGASNRITSIIPYNRHEMLVSTANRYYAVERESFGVRNVDSLGCKKMIRAKDGSILSFRFRKLTRFSEEFRVQSETAFPRYADNLFEDHAGIVWICAIDGLWRCDGKSDPYYLGAGIPELVTRVVDVDASASGIMWVATRGDGVIALHDDTVHVIKNADGLASNMCRSLFIENDSVTWVGTNHGVSRITCTQKIPWSSSIVNYTTENGLLSNEVSEIAGDGNRIWLVHTNGVSVFNPAQVEKSEFAPPVYVTSVTVNGDSVTGDGQSFSYDENYVSFSYVGLSFRDPGNVKYRYKLEGADRDWVYSKATVAAYQTLGAGDYRFLVQASSNEGVWSSGQASVNFTILPPWWQTWWFRTAVVLLASTLVYVGFRFRVRQIRARETRKTELQTRIATYELHALRAQMNPHFVFNSINSVQYFITNNDADSSQKYLAKFARLIRYVVDNSKLSRTALKKEIEALELYMDLEALRFENRLQYEIHVDADVDTTYVQIPSMLIQPYVENAIWHGIMHKKGKGKIVITLHMENEILCCIIEDDGIGRRRSQELKLEKEREGYKSVGMSNTKERLEIINHVTGNNLSVEITDLSDADGNATGTRVKIHVPVG